MHFADLLNSEGFVLHHAMLKEVTPSGVHASGIRYDAILPGFVALSIAIEGLEVRRYLVDGERPFGQVEVVVDVLGVGCRALCAMLRVHVVMVVVSARVVAVRVISTTTTTRWFLLSTPVRP